MNRYSSKDTKKQTANRTFILSKRTICLYFFYIFGNKSSNYNIFSERNIGNIPTQVVIFLICSFLQTQFRSFTLGSMFIIIVCCTMD